MKKINKKGFTIIEILAAVTIMGILTMLAIGALTTYLKQSRMKAYDIMAKSASNAAEEYIMDSAIRYITKDTVDIAVAAKEYQPATEADKTKILDAAVKLKTFDSYLTFSELVEEGYLKETIDPASSGKQCKGKVVIHYEKGDETKGQLDKYSYVVYEWCDGYSARYIYYYDVVKEMQKVVKPDGRKVEEEVEVLKPLTSVTTEKEFVGDPPTR